MSLPLVSVIIPAYNAQAWIEQTLASVLGQTYSHAQLEIILIDDGSTDATRAVAQRALSLRDMAFSLQTIANAGPSAARNFGWRRARGEWIQFLDADDLIKASKIEFQMRAACDTSANVAAIYSEWGRMVFTAQCWKQADEWVMPNLNNDPLCELLGSNNHMATGSQLFRRAWLERVNGYTEEYDQIEDVDLLARMVMGGGEFCAARAGRPLFWYRQRAHSLSRSNPVAFVQGCVRNARLVEAYWREHDALTAERAEFLTLYYFGAARALAQDAPREFERVAAYVYALQPNFVPPAPASLKWLTQVFGYPRAEKLMVRFRQVKRVFGCNTPRAEETAP